MKKILTIFGTRPEAIKMAPLVNALRHISILETVTISTQQHESLLSETLGSVGLKTDLELPAPDRSSVQSLVSTIVQALEQPISECDIVVVQGDTVSAYAGALAGFLQKVPWST